MLNLSQTAPEKIRLFCVDDNALVIDSLRRLVAHSPTLSWTGDTTLGDQVVERTRDLAPDIVLMDVDMPGVDTFSLVERLSAEFPAVRVIMLSGHVQPDYIDRALDSGAWGYLSKNDDFASLVDGISRVARGEVVMSKDVEAIHRRANPR